jgi:hypothetical protein
VDSQEQGVTVVKNRFAQRGPSRRVIVVISSVVAVLALFGVAAILVTLPPSHPAGESYSGESGVKASVFVPSARWNPQTDAIELSAIVTARIDTGATCTLTASQGSTVEKTQVDALADASTMTCANMSLPLNGRKGVWNIVVTYKAPQFSAESKPMKVEVGA